MWNIVSRIFLFAYDMLHRVSRRLLMLWTNTPKRITGDESKKKLLPDCREPVAVASASQLKYSSQSPVLKDVVIDMEPQEGKETAVQTKEFEETKVKTTECEETVVKTNDCVSLLGTGTAQEQEMPCEPEVIVCSTSESSLSRVNVFGDEGTSAKRLKVDGKGIQMSSNEVKQTEKKKEKRKKKVKGDDRKNLGTDKGDSRPNYFVAIQVSNSTIKSKVQEIQEAMLRKEITSESLKSKAQTGAVFRDTLVPVAKLHFTLHVFHLPDKDHLLKAKEIVEKIHSEIKQELEANPISLTIEGLGHFRNSVLFAKIKEPHHITRLEELSSMIREELESVDIFGDTKVFQPHMTIAKMSRSKKLHKLKVRSFPTELWADYELESLGTQRLEALQLLSMTESDPITGYYRCVAHLPFS